MNTAGREVNSGCQCAWKFHPVEINNTHRYVPKLLLLSEQCEETGANCMLFFQQINSGTCMQHPDEYQPNNVWCNS